VTSTTTAYCAICDSEDCNSLEHQMYPTGASGLEATRDDDPLDEESPSVGRLVPPPSSPMLVARLLVKNLFTDEAGRYRLRNHRGDFFRWDGSCWPEEEARGVRGAVYRWLEDAVYEKEDKGGVKIAPFDPTRRKVDDVLDALKAVVHLEGYIDPPAWTDGAGDLPADEVVAMGNGLLHIPTRTLLPHTPHYWTHHALPFDYDPGAPAPVRWLEFLHEIWGEDEDSIETFQEVVGNLVGGDTRQQKMYLLVGPKRSGKGTMGRVVTGLLGRHNVAAPTLAGLATNFGLSPLIDRPLALVSDARLSKRTDSGIVVERLLSVSGEDSLTIDRKYREPWTGRLPTRFMILTNELPRLADSSGALASRFIVFVLTKSFYGRENPALTDELLSEAPAIFNWALEGLDRLIQRGYFVQPKAGADALQQLEDVSSPIGAFVRDRCVRGSDATVGVDDFWTAWKTWCEEENRHPGTKAVFGRDLRAAVPTLRRSRSGGGSRTYIYSGIRLRDVGEEYIDQDLGHLGRDSQEEGSRPSNPRSDAMKNSQDESSRPSSPRSGAMKTSQNGFGEISTWAAPSTPFPAHTKPCTGCGQATFGTDLLCGPCREARAAS
jgi:putative DNA primase/helicase